MTKWMDPGVCAFRYADASARFSPHFSGDARAPDMPDSSLREYAFAFQPILDREQRVVGHELLYRNHLELDPLCYKNPVEMTASVIINAYMHSDEAYQSCNNSLFFNISDELLMSEMLRFIPKHNVTLELLETISPTPAIITRCKELKQLGYRFALDDFTRLTPETEAFLEIADIVKIDLPQIPRADLPALIKALRAWPVKLLVEKVETDEDFQYCLQLGADLFQGYHFAKPKFVSGKRPDPTKLTIVNLLGQLMADADDRIVEDVFRENPGLVYHLLRLVNTAAFALSTKIGSIRQALSLIGRNQLIRWIEMLLYSLDDDSTFPSALLQLAAKRGKLMELLARHMSHQLGTFQERSHMTGMLSLADTLLGMPMQEVLELLNPADEVRDALLHRGGRIGQLLALCECLENADFDTAEQLANELHIPITGVLQSQSDAMEWTCKLSG